MTTRAKRHRLTNRRLYKRSIANGKCVACRTRKARKGKKCCAACAKRHNAYSKHRRHLLAIKLRNLELMLQRQQEAP